MRPLNFLPRSGILAVRFGRDYSMGRLEVELIVVQDFEKLKVATCLRLRLKVEIQCRF